MFFSFTLLASSILASPISKHVVHESRTHLPAGWKEAMRMPGQIPIPLKIALKQSNIDQLEELLMSVSDPLSEKYGEHWTHEEAIAQFAPSQATIDTVTDWLVNAGISLERVRQSTSKHYIHLEASIEEAERLLKAEYYLYKHEYGTKHVACSEYSLPEHVSEHIDYVHPSINFDVQAKAPSAAEKRQLGAISSIVGSVGNVVNDLVNGAISSANVFVKDLGGLVGAVGRPFSPVKPKFAPVSNANTLPAAGSLDNCLKYITPTCLQKLYGIPTNNQAAVSAVKNSFGIVEYSPQAYLQSDLNSFWQYYGQGIPQGYAPTLQAIDRVGGPQQVNQGQQYNGESDLDLEYAMKLVYPQSVTLYQVGDDIQGGSFNTFLDGIDSSYCTRDGGDDPNVDPIYPSVSYPFKDCGKYKPASVISTSYGYNEADLSSTYMARQCNEYGILGMAGTTFLFSSGDAGVAGNGGQCLDSNGAYNDGSSGRFVPAFPSTCPYVTSVGATQLAQNINTNPPPVQPEVACQTVIQSGGGFSDVFALPSYQRNAVIRYFKAFGSKYTASQYRNDGRTRGYPDIAMNGKGYITVVDGAFSVAYGTSASAPVAGALITLINQARLKAGKKVLGFINPLLYLNGGNYTTDVTSGQNPGCGTQGFSAMSGWDPVTGLGTLQYSKLLYAA